MANEDLSADRVRPLPSRLLTATFFSPVVVINTNIALAINAANLSGSQAAMATTAAHIQAATS